MSELLEYLHKTKLKKWIFEVRNGKDGNGYTHIINESRIINIVSNKEYENSMYDDNLRETHLYNPKLLTSLLELLDILEVDHFEIIKNPLRPLCLKCEFFCINIAPRVNEEDPWEEDPWEEDEDNE